MVIFRGEPIVFSKKLFVYRGKGRFESIKNQKTIKSVFLKFQKRTVQKSLSYRPDIDGLRAVAVLSVVIYHFFPHALRGGFTGVDIFFVISGFLIARIIFAKLDENRFSFLDFYARRIRRIFPALIVVLLAGFAVGRYLFFDFEFLLLAKHLAAGAFFFSNFLLRKEVGYFDADAEFKPFLHLWSLSIEEQFYIAFPLLVWLTFNRNARVWALLIVLATLSFYLNMRHISRRPEMVFYMPWTRMWELLAGAILARLSIRGGGLKNYSIKSMG